jgi:hypothetical protein
MAAEIEQHPGRGDRIYKRIQAISASDQSFQTQSYQVISTNRLQH